MSDVEVFPCKCEVANIQQPPYAAIETLLAIHGFAIPTGFDRDRLSHPLDALKFHERLAIGGPSFALALLVAPVHAIP